MDPIISLQSVEKAYPLKVGSYYVLRNIDLDIEAGEFVSIMGPSGAGKSTLLNILGMYDGKFAGAYYLAGNAIHQMKPKDRMALQRETIGFVFQRFHLLEDLTVYENLEIPLTYRNVPRREREGIVADMLDRFNVVGKKELFPNQLSGGQQQLVSIARAIIAEPKLILADEPTGNLHSEQGQEIMELFKRLNDEGTTIIQVTHSEELAKYGDRVIRLKDGWMV